MGKKSLRDRLSLSVVASFFGAFEICNVVVQGEDEGLHFRTVFPGEAVAVVVGRFGQAGRGPADGCKDEITRFLVTSRQNATESSSPSWDSCLGAL